MQPKHNPKQAHRLNQTLVSGTMMAACPFLSDAPFHRRLLLLAEHSCSGSVAFVLNEYSGFRLGELLPGFAGWDVPVWTGGPVEDDTLHIVQVQSAGLADSTEIIPGIWWNAHPAKAMKLANEGLLDQTKWYFFLGYAGWSPRQLEHEFDDHHWILGHYNPYFLPDEGSRSQWAQFLIDLGEPYNWLSGAPTHPSLN
jgi:putative transcriptional regulator